MGPFRTLSDESLLDALTEYYERYKRTVKLAGDEWEYSTCRLAIHAILTELNERRIEPRRERDVVFRRRPR
jgi:hypothetical protein